MIAQPQPSIFRFTQSAILAALLLLPASISAQPSQAAAPGFVNTLMPLPSTLKCKPRSLHIDRSFSYSLHGDSGPRLSDAAVRLLSRLETSTGISLAKSPAPQGRQPTLATVSTQAVPQLDVDESYTLDITDHSIALRAKTDIGALHGMETLLQLLP